MSLPGLRQAQEMGTEKGSTWKTKRRTMGPPTVVPNSTHALCFQSELGTGAVWGRTSPAPMRGWRGDVAQVMGSAPRHSPPGRRFRSQRGWHPSHRTGPQGELREAGIPCRPVGEAGSL